MNTILEKTSDKLRSDSGPTSSVPHLSTGQLLLKSTALAIGIFLVMVLISAVIIAIFGYRQYQSFLSSAGLTHSQVVDLYTTARDTQPSAKSGKTVILLLGVDSVSNKVAAPLTDTLMLISVDTENAHISTLPLPRDLWSNAYQTKINALYYYGFERHPDRPEAFVEEVVTEMTGIPIDYTVVVSLNQVAEIIDLVDGIEIDVPTTFTDNQFPRDDILPSEATTEAELYMTVTFDAGSQHFSGKQALQYIRSRFSEGDTGTDDDRGKRQQLVMTALAERILAKSILLDTDKLGSLYRWYDSNLHKYVPMSDAGSIALNLLPHRDSIASQQHQLPIFPEHAEGVIENPKTISQYQNQWVYRIIEPELFQHFAQNVLIESTPQLANEELIND